MRRVPICAPKSEAESVVGDVRAVAQQKRFGIVIEGQADCHASAVGPRLWRELAADAGHIHCLAKLLVAPFRARLAALLSAGGGEREHYYSD